jgi:hypothetical protein
MAATMSTQLTLVQIVLMAAGESRSDTLESEKPTSAEQATRDSLQIVSLQAMRAAIVVLQNGWRMGTLLFRASHEPTPTWGAKWCSIYGQKLNGYTDAS